MTPAGARPLSATAFVHRLASGPPGLRGLLAVRLAHPHRLAALLGEPDSEAFEAALCSSLDPCLLTEDRWARAALDEVWLLLEDLSDDAQALERAQRILETLQRLPGSDSGSAVPLACGLVLHEGPAGGHARPWLAAALEEGKRSRRHDDPLEVHRFNAPLAAETDDFLEGILRETLRHDRLAVHFQPQIALHSGRCVQLEALMRWPAADATSAPAHGVNAARLAAVAERRGLIGTLTRRVLDRALAQVRAWEVQGLRIDVSVNLSALNLEDASVASFVLDACLRHRLAPERLTLELTESRVVRNRQAARAFLQRIRAAGVRVALDDFGTGYASISTLRELQFDELKIDRAFVSDPDGSPSEQALAGALVALGRSLGLQTLVEGIETREQAHRLAQVACDRGQGYFWAPPLSADAFERWFSGFTPTPLT